MELDVFFSISQTPVEGHTPSEADMLRVFLTEVEAADALGYGVAWVAESHLSTAVQKRNRRPVVPHWLQWRVGWPPGRWMKASRVSNKTVPPFFMKASMARIAVSGGLGCSGRSGQ